MKPRYTDNAATGAPRGDGPRAIPTAALQGSPKVRRLVEVLLTRRSVQRPALARETGLALQTVADLLAGLASRGLVVVNGRMTGMPGRSTLSYSLAAPAAVGLWVHVTAGWTETTLYDLRGALIASYRMSLSAVDAAELVEHIEKATRLICQQAGIELFRLGAASVALEDYESDPNWLVALLAQQLGCTVELDTEQGEPSEHLERAHLILLKVLFGDAS